MAGMSVSVAQTTAGSDSSVITWSCVGLRRFGVRVLTGGVDAGMLTVSTVGVELMDGESPDF